MKRSIGAALLAAVAAGGKWLSGSPVLSSPGYARFRATGAALRNPADPVQAARIEAAAAKRDRKAKKLGRTASGILNRAHRLSYNANALNPFYIAK